MSFLVQNCSIEPTAFPTSIRIHILNPTTKHVKTFIAIAATKNSYLGWKNALTLMVKDYGK